MFFLSHGYFPIVRNMCTAALPPSGGLLALSTIRKLSQNYNNENQPSLERPLMLQMLYPALHMINMKGTSMANNDDPILNKACVAQFSGLFGIGYYKKEWKNEIEKGSFLSLLDKKEAQEILSNINFKKDRKI